MSRKGYPAPAIPVRLLDRPADQRQSEARNYFAICHTVPSFPKNLIAIFPCGEMAMYKNEHEKAGGFS